VTTTPELPEFMRRYATRPAFAAVQAEAPEGGSLWRASWDYTVHSHGAAAATTRVALWFAWAGRQFVGTHHSKPTAVGAIEFYLTATAGLDLDDEGNVR
jgi:hypothetical protein